MKKILILFLIGSIAVSTLTGCNGNSSKKNQAGKTETSAHASTSEEKNYNFDTISVTYVKSPLNVPSIIEKEKGFFADAFSSYGLNVSYSNLTTGPEQTQALASGDIQFLYAVGATSVILAASNDSDIKIVNTYSRSPDAFCLFTNNDSITSPEDLRGKKVAGPKGTILHELLIAYLATAGMTENDIEFYAMDIPSSQAALIAKEVDCALLAGATAYNMEKDGYTVITTGEGLVNATIVTATSNTFYEENPELVQAFVDAQKTILTYMEDNYDEIMEITAAEAELDADAVKEMYPMYDFNFKISESDIESMKRTEEFMRVNDMTEKEVDVESLILDLEFN